MRRDNRNREHAIVHRIPGPRIQDVTVAPSLVNEMTEIITRSRDGMVGHRHPDPDMARIPRILQANMPGAFLGRPPVHPNIRAEIDQHITDRKSTRLNSSHRL